MKDNVIAGLMAGIMVLGCTAAFDGCSSAGESMETSAGEDTVDTVEAVETSETASKTGTAEDYPNSYIISLGEYTGIEVEAADTEVTDEELQEAVNEAIMYCSDLVETGRSAVEAGDIVYIDYELEVDSVDLGDDGTVTDACVEIGSGDYIDGFEDGLVGAVIGEAVTLELTFPDDYASEDVAGRDAVFTVTVTSIMEYDTPEYNDDFVYEYYGFDTVEEFEADLLASLEEEKAEDAEYDRAYAVINTIIANSEFYIDDDDLQSVVDEQYETYEEYAEYYGMDLEEFMTGMYGMTLDEFEEQTLEYAEFNIRCQLIVEAVAQAEDITLDDDEYAEELQTLADTYGDGDADGFEEEYGADYIMQTLIYEKTLEFIVDSAVETSSK